MKTLRIIIGVGVAMSLLGLNVVQADMKNASSKVPLSFSLDFGDSSVVMPELTFDAVDGASGEEAQQTCAMTPGGVASSLLLQLPSVSQMNNNTEGYSRASSQVSLSPLYSLPPPSHSPNGRGRTGRPFNPPTLKVSEDDPPADVPEPATLVIVGLGIGAAAVARRWKNR